MKTQGKQIISSYLRRCCGWSNQRPRVREWEEGLGGCGRKREATGCRRRLWRCFHHPNPIRRRRTHVHFHALLVDFVVPSHLRNILLRCCAYYSSSWNPTNLKRHDRERWYGDSRRDLPGFLGSGSPQILRNLRNSDFEIVTVPCI
jgi:hypothetical protein